MKLPLSIAILISFQGLMPFMVKAQAESSAQQQCEQPLELSAIGQARYQETARRNARIKLLNETRKIGVESHAPIEFQCEKKWWWHCTAHARVCATTQLTRSP